MSNLHSALRYVNKSLVLLFALFVVFAGTMAAQVTSGSISGVVKDSSGAAVPGGNVVAVNSAVGVTRTVSSSEDGSFVVTNLPPGTYNISVEVTGFKKLEKTGVVLTPRIE